MRTYKACAHTAFVPARRSVAARRARFEAGFRGRVDIRTTIRIDTPTYGANVASLGVSATAPGLFSLSGTGQGRAAELHQDGTVSRAIRRLAGR